MIDVIFDVLKLLADVLVTGGIFLAVVALAFEPLITGRRR